MKDPLKDYLAHCYLYYSLSENVIDDHSFDSLCKGISKNWDSITSPYKHFVFNLEKGEIEGIKGSELGDDCPKEIKEYAIRLLADYKDFKEVFLRGS